MTATTSIDHTVLVSLAIADAKGNPTAAPAVPVWTLDNPTVATVVAAADGMTAVVTPTTVGVVNLTVTVGSLTASVAITFTAGAPATITITTTIQ